MNFPGGRRVCPDHIALQRAVCVILRTRSLLDRDKLEAQVGTEGRCKRGFPRRLSGKEPACQCRRLSRRTFDPWVGKIPWRRAWQPTPVLLPGESHGQRSLVGYSPWDGKESNMTDVT